MASAENISYDSIWPLYVVGVKKVLAEESKLKPSLTRERKKLNSRTEEGIYFLPGTNIFA